MLARLLAAIALCACSTTDAAPAPVCDRAYVVTACDASAQCALLTCTCNDGTVSAATRGGLCSDAGRCDDAIVCTRFCQPAQGVANAKACTE